MVMVLLWLWGCYGVTRVTAIFKFQRIQFNKMTANKATPSPRKTRSSPAKSKVMLGSSSSSAVAAATTTLPNTVKLVSWNVAGIAACLKKGLLKYLKAEDADIVCM